MGKTRAHVALGILLVLLLGLVTVQADEKSPAEAVQVDLPRVGTLGTAPSGADAIVVTVAGDGGIYVRGRGPLDLLELRDDLQLLTNDPAWREPDHSSRKRLLVNADASLPWVISQWIMQVAAEPTVQLYKISFGARPRTGDGVGAIGWRLPKDRGLSPTPFTAEVKKVSVKLFQNLAPGSDPEALLPLLVAARKRLGDDAKAIFEVKAPRPKGMPVPTGYVLKVLEVAARAGFADVRFEGTPAPISVRNRPETERGWVRREVARLKAVPGTPTIKLGDAYVPPNVAEGVQVPASRGLLSTPFGFRVHSSNRLVMELEEVPEEEDGEAGDAPFSDPVIKGGEVEDNGGIGLGGGAGGAFRGRGGNRGLKDTDTDAERRRVTAIEDALKWLKAHQAPNGSWEAKQFGRWCDGRPATGRMPDGPGKEIYDVGVTGLALCAFLGQGYTQVGNHPYAETLKQGLRYLKNVQDEDGCFGPRTHQQYIYNHAVAALATVEAYGLTASPILKHTAQKSLDFIMWCQNPYFTWRYGIKPGDNDTSVTAWMTMVLKSAQRINQDAVKRGKPAPLKIDEKALLGVERWIEKMTDSDYGRVGYIQRGGAPARMQDTVDKFPGDKSESMTAAGMLCRVLVGQSSESVIVRKGAKLLSRAPPTWNPADGSIDMYYWFYGTLAMHQVGGDLWRAWNDKMLEAVVGHQRQDTTYCEYKGSWPPIGPWGREGGRVYSTAILALTLETQHR